MRKFLGYLITLLFIGCLAVASKAQSLLYYNNFNVAQPAWKDYDDPLSNAKVTGGKYILTHKQHTSSVVANVVPVDYSRDFAIETSVTHISGGAYPFGIVFGGLNATNTYVFGISYNGQFIILESVAGTNKIITNWTPSTAIKQGVAVNKLRIEKSDNQLKYFINDVLVTQTAVLPKLGDAIGIIVQEQQTAAFDYLKVTYIDPVTGPPANTVRPLSADIVEPVYHTDFDKDDQNEWVLKATDSSSTAISNGYFNIFRRAKLGMTESVTNENAGLNVSRDYLIETAAVHYSGTTNYGYGLDFGCDSTRTYHFLISPEGYYTISYNDPKGYHVITPWTTAGAINKTANALNKLTLVHKGAQLNFYINDQLATNMPDLNLKGRRYGVSVSADQNAGFDYITFGYLDKAPAVQNTTADNTGPEIYITSPQVTRGLKIVQSSDVVHVAGVAKDPGGILSVVVNGVKATLKDGNFTADIPVDLGDNALIVVATDTKLNIGSYKFSIVRNAIDAGTQADVAQSAAKGKYYALLIGVQDYQDQTIQSLQGPVDDASSLFQALTQNYTFAPGDVTLLKNPTRAQFFNSLRDIETKATADDNVVIFFAGHGHYDDDRHQGYWLPADADRQREDTWISNSDVISEVTGLKAKHLLLIADACFGGSIFRARSIEGAPKDIQELYKLTSRKAMTSGNMKEVPDKSAFMHYLVKNLNANTDKFLPAEQLFTSLKPAVINNSEGAEPQVPQFGAIREAGDEGGDFIFIRKN